MQVQGRTGRTARSDWRQDLVNIPRSKTLSEHRLDEDVLVVEQQHGDCNFFVYIQSGAVELLMFKCRGWGRDR